MALLGTILFGLFFVLEVFILDGGEVTWEYPSTVVSAAHILPGLCVIAVFTPVRWPAVTSAHAVARPDRTRTLTHRFQVGLRELLSIGASLRSRLTTRPSTVAQSIDVEALRVSTLRKKLASARAAYGKAAAGRPAPAPAHQHDLPPEVARLMAAAAPVRSSPNLLPTSPTRTIMSFDELMAQPTATPATAASDRDAQLVRRRRHSATSRDSSVVRPTWDATGLSDALSAPKLKAEAAALEVELGQALARKEAAEGRQRCRRWVAWVVWPFRAVVGWLLFAVCLLLSTLVVVKAGSRPFLAVASEDSRYLFDQRPFYHWAFGISFRAAALVRGALHRGCVRWVVR